MLSANITNKTRKAIYRRDGWRCALCDSTKNIQVHHYIRRSRGGSNSLHNLICLCGFCHATAHGVEIYNDFSQEDLEQAIVEYLEDTYCEDWNPWKRE